MIFERGKNNRTTLPAQILPPGIGNFLFATQTEQLEISALIIMRIRQLNNHRQLTHRQFTFQTILMPVIKVADTVIAGKLSVLGESLQIILIGFVGSMNDLGQLVKNPKIVVGRRYPGDTRLT